MEGIIKVDATVLPLYKTWLPNLSVFASLCFYLFKLTGRHEDAKIIEYQT